MTETHWRQITVRLLGTLRVSAPGRHSGGAILPIYDALGHRPSSTYWPRHTNRVLALWLASPGQRPDAVFLCLIRPGATNSAHRHCDAALDLILCRHHRPEWQP